jgi:hypothetical protein
MAASRHTSRRERTAPRYVTCSERSRLSDHYLGKQLVYNIVFFCFAHAFLESFWDRNLNSVSRVQAADKEREMHRKSRNMVWLLVLEAVRKLMYNKSIAYKSLKVWQEIDCPVSLFLALPGI